MKVVKLLMKFELQIMKKYETIKEYSNKLLGIINKIKFSNKEFPGFKIVEKLHVTSLENTKH